MSGVLEELARDWEVVPYFYNPNIWPEREYQKRLEAAKKAIGSIRANTSLGVAKKLIVGDYDAGNWEKVVKDLEGEPEGGKRCEACFRMRLEATAKKARELGIKNFATTLSISPHKNTGLINKVGRGIVKIPCYSTMVSKSKEKEGVATLNFIEKDFSKLYHKSLEESKKAGLYRQKYCGCKFSLKSVN